MFGVEGGAVWGWTVRGLGLRDVQRAVLAAQARRIVLLGCGANPRPLVKKHNIPCSRSLATMAIEPIATENARKFAAGALKLLET